jgi:hypothetical protein
MAAHESSTLPFHPQSQSAGTRNPGASRLNMIFKQAGSIWLEDKNLSSDRRRCTIIGNTQSHCPALFATVPLGDPSKFGYQLPQEVVMKVPSCPCPSLCFLFLLVCAVSVAQSSGPDERQITDPRSIISAPNPNVRPIPIEDLYYTRSVAGASWSPDGKEILFTTDMSGRSNLWKVSAAGGWPLQLTQSDDWQYGTWSPDGKWIIFQQDFGGKPRHCEDVPQLGMAGKSSTLPVH